MSVLSVNRPQLFEKVLLALVFATDADADDKLQKVELALIHNEVAMAVWKEPMKTQADGRRCEDGKRGGLGRARGGAKS